MNKLWIFIHSRIKTRLINTLPGNGGILWSWHILRNLLLPQPVFKKSFTPPSSQELLRCLRLCGWRLTVNGLYGLYPRRLISISPEVHRCWAGGRVLSCCPQIFVFSPLLFFFYFGMSFWKLFFALSNNSLYEEVLEVCTTFSKGSDTRIWISGHPAGWRRRIWLSMPVARTCVGGDMVEIAVGRKWQGVVEYL